MGWDTAIALFQWVMSGTAAYVSLVGIPSTPALHAEDAAFQRLLLTGLGTRATAERASVFASRNVGGCQAPSVVEAVLPSVVVHVVATVVECARGARCMIVYISWDCP